MVNTRESFVVRRESIPPLLRMITRRVIPTSCAHRAFENKKQEACFGSCCRVRVYSLLPLSWFLVLRMMITRHASPAASLHHLAHSCARARCVPTPRKQEKTLTKGQPAGGTRGVHLGARGDGDDGREARRDRAAVVVQRPHARHMTGCVRPSRARQAVVASVPIFVWERSSISLSFLFTL